MGNVAGRAYSLWQKIGSFTLRAAPRAGDNGTWIAECECRRLVRVHPSRKAMALARGVVVACKACCGLAVRRPPLCRHAACATMDPARFQGKKRSECSACERRRIRNSLCPACATPLRRCKGRSWCDACGLGGRPRQKGARFQEALLAIRGLFGANVAPTVRLVKSIARCSHKTALLAIKKYPTVVIETRAPAPASLVAPARVVRAPDTSRPSIADLAARWLRGESTEKLAAEVGISKATLRWHFSTKGYRKTRQSVRGS